MFVYFFFFFFDETGYPLDLHVLTPSLPTRRSSDLFPRSPRRGRGLRPRQSCGRDWEAAVRGVCSPGRDRSCRRPAALPWAASTIALFSETGVRGDWRTGRGVQPPT